MYMEGFQRHKLKTAFDPIWRLQSSSVCLSSHAAAQYIFSFSQFLLFRLPLSLCCLHSDLVLALRRRLFFLRLLFQCSRKEIPLKMSPAEVTLKETNILSWVKYWLHVLIFPVSTFIEVWSSPKLLQGHSAVFITLRMSTWVEWWWGFVHLW